MTSLKMRSDSAPMHHKYQKVWSFNSIVFVSDSWPQIKITKNDVDVKRKCSRKKKDMEVRNFRTFHQAKGAYEEKY